MKPEPQFLLQPLRDVDAWVRHFRDAEIPVLSYTAQQIDELALDEDSADVNVLADTINDDPLMTLRLLRHVGSQRRGNQVSAPETVLEALVLIGVCPLFRNFGQMPTVQDWLSDSPEALEGLSHVIVQGHRAASFAQGFAAHRSDPDASVIHEVALLHHFVEMLFWLHAPKLALEIIQRQAAQPGLRTLQAQKEILGIDFRELRLALMKEWRLPELLVQLVDDKQARSPQVRSVLLAVRLARHTTHGWEHPALDDDIRDISELLHLGIEPTRRLLPQLA
ncbi:MAG: HDOD domain-containing protein [Pseudomonadota bacterium]|nr:HDOD domain-containing protein [Pseudomonadota bacterium]